MHPVPDIIAPDLMLLFIGFNPGVRSAQTGHHFAGHANRFWKLLAESGLTPRLLKPEEDRTLPTFGIGITNIVARFSRTAAEITAAEYTSGSQILRQKLRFYHPHIACYAGIGVYRHFTGQKTVKPGLQPENEVPGITDFVLPSPSGLNRIPLATQLACYKQLRELAKSASDA